jgi:hypothetical protein
MIRREFPTAGVRPSGLPVECPMPLPIVRYLSFRTRGSRAGELTFELTVHGRAAV